MNNTMVWDKKLFSKIMTIFGFIMVAVFFGIGITLAFFPVYTYLPREIRIIFGFFFIAYGFFRLARIIQQLRLQKREE
jgi:cytochrome c biogenesis protein CcdA